MHNIKNSLEAIVPLCSSLLSYPKGPIWTEDSSIKPTIDDGVDLGSTVMSNSKLPDQRSSRYTVYTQV